MHCGAPRAAIRRLRSCIRWNGRIIENVIGAPGSCSQVVRKAVDLPILQSRRPRAGDASSSCRRRTLSASKVLLRCPRQVAFDPGKLPASTGQCMDGDTGASVGAGMSKPSSPKRRSAKCASSQAKRCAVRVATTQRPSHDVPTVGLAVLASVHEATKHKRAP
jgi:hypothetical protein